MGLMWSYRSNTTWRPVIKTLGRWKRDNARSTSEMAYHSRSTEKSKSRLACMLCRTICFCLVNFWQDLMVATHINENVTPKNNGSKIISTWLKEDIYTSRTELLEKGLSDIQTRRVPRDGWDTIIDGVQHPHDSFISVPRRRCRYFEPSVLVKLPPSDLTDSDSIAGLAEPWLKLCSDVLYSLEGN